jgi:hypothetical protein
LRRMSRRFVELAAAVILLVALAASPAAATKVISHKTIRNAVIPAGAHNRIYDHVKFTGGGAQRAVLQISRACHNITFRRCVIASGLWNGISINDKGGIIHDITFVHCRIRSQKRMGFECTNRPVSSTKGYHGIKVLNCVFSPQGSEAISFDGGTGCYGNRVSNTVIKGAGINPNQTYGAGIECNGVRNFRFTKNKVYQCRGSLLNLQMHTTADCGWIFTGNVLNASVHYQTVPMDSNAQVVVAHDVYGGSFRDNYVTSAAPGGGVAWFGDCHGMDWRGTTWRDARKGSWDDPYEEQGSSGNMF